MNLEGLTKKITSGRWNTIYYENKEKKILAKVCAECNGVKSIEGFTVSKKGLGGRCSKCTDCRKAYRKENKDTNAKRKKQYAVENKERIREYKKKWAINNKEKLSEYRKRYNELNKEREQLKKKKWYEKNKEKLIERQLIYNEANKEYIKEYTSGWHKKNKFKKHIYYQRRRANKLGLPQKWSEEIQSELLLKFNYECALTGSKSIHLDHVIPLSIGHGGTFFGNIVPLREDLNISKNNRNIFEWFETNRQRFELSQERFDNLIEWLASANAMSVEEYRDYVYWCHANPRTVDEINETNEGGTAS